METCGVRSLSLPSQTRGRLGRVSKSPERAARAQWYQRPPLLIATADSGPTTPSALAGRGALRLTILQRGSEALM